MRKEHCYRVFHPSPTRFYIRDRHDHIVGEALDVPRDKNRYRQRANAQMFAAAPELLATLKECRAMLDQYRNGNNPAVGDTISRADIAIGNAEPGAAVKAPESGGLGTCRPEFSRPTLGI